MRTSLASIVFALVLVAGCDSGQPLVVVTVHGARTGAASLTVLVELNGKQAMHLESFTATSTDLGLELPAGSTGNVTVSVAGLDTSSCIVSFASATHAIDGGGRIDLTVTLQSVSPPQCPTS
jgi:hypothetical protein